MSDSVDRLKELLFDSEKRALADLALRVDAVSGDIKARSEKDEALRRLIVADIDSLAERTESLHRSLGSPGSLRTSVAGIIDGALSDAEISHNEELTKAVAPLVVRTIKSEIRNSQDEMVEALYPVTGRMVQAYVASAMRDLMEQINRRLESNWLMLGMKSLTTGRSPAELALAESQRLGIEEVYLIRRFRGELVGHWPKATGPKMPGSDRDQVLSGVLSAINEFTTEAFRAEGSSLRQVDLGHSKLYLRASPTYLLAVRTSGYAPAAVEQVMDEEFLATLERYRDRLNDEGRMPVAGGSGMMQALAPEAARWAAPPPALESTDILSELFGNLGRRVAQTQAALGAPPFGLTPLRILGIGVGLPALALAGWLGWGWFQASQARAGAAEVLEASEAVKGYPIAIDVSARGRTVTLTGLVPSLVARSDLDARMKTRLPRAEVRDEMTVVPGGTDTGYEIAKVRRDLAAQSEEQARLSIRRVLERAIRRVEQTRPGLEQIRDAVTAAHGPVAPVSGVIATVSEAIGDLNAERARLLAPLAPGTVVADASAGLLALAHRLADAGADIAQLLGDSARSTASLPQMPTGDLAESAEQVSSEAERLAAIVIAVSGTYPLSQRPMPAPVTIVQPAPPAPPAPPAIMPAIDPRSSLAAWCQAHAVFFADKTDYRDPAQAKATIAELAGLLSRTDAAVRIVGYTDERGASTRNALLSQERADRVADDLRALGIDGARVVAIGRKAAADISHEVGPMSPNRRVEFEVGFFGESSAP